MNINKYLKKLNVKYTYNSGDEVFIFKLPNGESKPIPKKELEQYLFIKLVEYIGIEL